VSERLVRVFQEMVRIDSESGEEQAFLAYLSDLFARDLKAKCWLDGHGNLLGRVPAVNCDSEAPILLSCHGDTVKPGRGIEPVLVDGVIRSQGDTILGADDKAGIAEVYEALMSAKRHPEVEIVVTRQEELGMVGARNLDVSALRQNGLRYGRGFAELYHHRRAVLRVHRRAHHRAGGPCRHGAGEGHLRHQSRQPRHLSPQGRLD